MVGDAVEERAGESLAGEGVTKIVDAHVVEPGALTDAPPRVLQVRQVAPRLASRDHPGVVLVPVESAQHRDCRITEMQHLGARLRVGQRPVYGKIIVQNRHALDDSARQIVLPAPI